MVLDVTHVLRTPGERLPFQFSLALSDMEFSGRRPISRPVAVEGEVRNSADVLTLSMTVSTTLDAVCDRCGKAFYRRRPFRTAVCWRRSSKTRTTTILFCWNRAG